ncbi:MAG: hypothetical protein JWR07_5021, partial [Nevskia sp.]|nr:hypothetical protein [Nevskia sp.]
GNDLLANVAQLDPRGDPEGRFKLTYGPVWGDFVITELGHADGSLVAYKGNDYIAGGAGDDTLLGELGNDVIQGDGSIDFVSYQRSYDASGLVVVTPTVRGRVGASRGADGTYNGAASTGLLTWFASFDNPTTNQKNNDGHDYLEAGGGNDVVFGNQGQDDIVGGSSDFFKKTDGSLVNLTANNTPDKRPDGNDVIYGGSGTATARNDIGAATQAADLTITTTATGHGDDADTIAADNADIVRLAGINGTVSATPTFLTFNYDNYDSSKTVRLVPHAVRLLDYTPGGPNYSAAALSNIGGNDEVHGESGDDVVYAQKGDDRLFGDGQDDDLIGGWGNDWISGGTGNDGVIGDDGRIFTSRNSATFGESLYGIVALKATDADPKNTNGDVLNEFIYTPGNVQTAFINVPDELKKTVDITPFSSDPNWNGSADEFGVAGTAGTGGVGKQPNHVNDDIIFGGLGSDWLHGGSGDDAILGGEALPTAAAGTPSLTQPASVNGVAGVVAVDNLVVSGWLRPYNPGNILAFDPVDANGQHADHRTRAGEFALYDEYNPLRKIMVAAPGSNVVYDFLLNFNETEGVLRPAGVSPGNNNTSVAYPQVNDDGGDRIFGDLGNDWMVGGTGRDDVYGGMGNDLMNVDDNMNSTAATADPLANNVPDTQPYFEDRAFGGGGRDVLIANTGGDRLMDWTGEFNSYLVPFAPFGMATVSRTLQPQLPEFLYALSGSDGADATRYSDMNNGAAPPAPSNSDPMPSRNGEPFGELGLVLQKDAAWHDTHGGPSDPQAGNIAGGKRDVLRSASFDDGGAQGFVAVSGSWAVTNKRYQVSSTTSSNDAISLFNEADTVIPSYFEMQATINAVKPLAGVKANTYLIFDFQSATDFKFAGINISTNKIEIGHRTASGWVVDKSTPGQFKAGTDYIVMLAVNDVTATLTIGSQSLSYTYAARIDSLGVRHGMQDGLVGIGANGASAQIDNVVVQAPPGATTLDKIVDFSSTSPASQLFNTSLPATGSWLTTSDGRFLATAISAATPAIDLIGYPVTAGSTLSITTTLKTFGQGGVVFDYQGQNYFKYATLSADGKQIVIGHRTPGAWITDATFKTPISAGTDYKLGVTLKGGLVNVSLNGAVVASFLYNETVTNGGYGLLSFKGASSGQTSFDIIEVKTDDAAYAPPPAPLTAAAAPVSPAAGGDLRDEAQLQPLLALALERWALNEDKAFMQALSQVHLQIADLPGLELGEYRDGTIYIDVDAAGYGWFVDQTPGDDSEYGADGYADHGIAARRMDLLSVIAHELGHAGGLGHAESGVMGDTLAAGWRTLLGAAPTPPASIPVPVAGSLDFTPVAAALAGVAAPEAGNPAPRIDWQGSYRGGTRQPAAAGGGRWLDDFINHGGQSEAHRNPNAGLKVHVPVSSKALPAVSRM